MSIDLILSRLEGVRRTRHDSWIACCPAHDDKHPSLSIRETGDGKILLHCFTGCDVGEILAALDLDVSALFPDAPKTHRMPSERRPFPAADVLRCVGFDVLKVAATAKNMSSGHPLTESDLKGLVNAAVRLQAACAAAGVSS
jgi:hypothetical protein